MTQQRQIYEQVWDKTYLECHAPKLQMVLSLTENLDPHVVLDLGCGDGIISHEILKQTYCTLIGIDISVNNIRHARSRVPHLLIADLEHPLPFRSSTLDLCLALDIIEHVIDTDNFLLEIHRVLTNTGKLILVTPNLASLTERLLLLFGYQPQNVEVSRIKKFGSIRKTPPVGHFRGFTWPALKEMLQYYGFRIDEFRVTTYYTGLLKVMDHVVGRLKKTFASLFVVRCEKNDLS